MRRLVAPALVVAAVVGALPPLLLLEGGGRTTGFRLYGVVVGVLALRAVTRWVDAQPAASPPPPFRRPRLRRRVVQPVPVDPAEQLVRLATFSAGDVHRGLRPVLQVVADERLRARHRCTLTDPGAASLLGTATWELLRPDRPRPVDRRGPGLTPEQIDAVLADLEAL